MTMRPDASERPTAVCGMYRSGTSLVASLVHAWGAFGGSDDELIDGDEANPRGFWQTRGLTGFLSELTREIGIGFWRPGFADAVRGAGTIARHRDAGLRLLAGMRASGRPWFWKDPLLSVCLPFWNALWRDAVYVITIRHPYATALSWQKHWLPAEAHGQLHIVAAMLLQWQALMRAVLEDTVGRRSVHFVRYDDLIARPEDVCRQLADYLSDAYDGRRADAAQVAAMVARVDPALRRATVTMAFDDAPEATDAQKALYRFLLARAADPALPFDSRQYALHPAEMEYLDNLRVLSAIYRGRTWRPAAALTAR